MEKYKLEYWLGFSLIPGIGPVRFGQLEAAFGTLENAWLAKPAELKHAGLDDNAVKNIVRKRPEIDLDAEMRRLEALNIRLVTCHDSAYPAG
jgi:DNA processing protein